MSECGAHRNRIGWLAAGAVVIAAVCAGGSSAAGSQPSAAVAASLLRTALQDASSRGSVHEVLVGVTGSKSGALVDDVTTDEGRQDITRYGGVHAHVLVVGGNAFYSGNQAALIDYFGLAPSTAKQIGSRWVLVARSNSDYSTVAADVTLSSALIEATPPGPLSETAPTTIDGESVIGIRGTPHAPKGVSASEILYVSRSAKPLPVQLVVSSRTKNLRGHSTTDFSHWGEPLTLTMPTNVVSLTPSS